MAKTVMDQLMKTGKVRRGMLGVTIQSVDADLASSLSLPSARGAIVTSVANGGPAERAGLKRGDVITAINKQPVIDNNSLRNLVASQPPGSNVDVTASRNGRDQNFQVALAELPDRERPESEEEDTSSTGAAGNQKFGLTMQPLTAAMAQRSGLEATDEGLLVTRIDPNGSAAEAGIRQGDLIQEVNRQPVKTVVEFSAAMQRSGAKPALVLVKRRNGVVYLTLKTNS
jgi:S1-C subfamily serine protease